jgi:hypothetical protein
MVCEGAVNRDQRGVGSGDVPMGLLQWYGENAFIHHTQRGVVGEDALVDGARVSTGATLSPALHAAVKE